MFHVRYLADTLQREYIWCGDKISSTSQGNCRLLCDIRKKSWTSTIPGKFSTKLVVVGWDGTFNLCYVAEVNSIDWMFFTKQLLRLRKQNSPKVFPPRKFCTEQIIDLLSMDILWLSYSSSKWITNFVNYWNNLGRRYFHQERRGQFTAVTYLSILSVVFFGGSGFPQHKCRLWKCGHQRWPCRWAISVEQRLISNPPIGPWSTAYLPTQRWWPIMTQHKPKQGRRQHPKNQQPITTPEVSPSPIFHIQTWLESTPSLISRNSSSTAHHPNYKEETNNHRTRIEALPTNADCAIWKNCMNMHLCPFQQFSSTPSSLNRPLMNAEM